MLLEVGRVTRAHGIRGEVIVELVTDRIERVAPGAALHTGNMTLVVERSSPHHGRWIVAFAGVGDRNAAEALRGVVLSAPPIDDPSALWVHDLIGSRVVDTDGTDRGEVVAVVANPASDLLELEDGTLVPLRFVAGFSDGVVRVDVPEGLWEP